MVGGQYIQCSAGKCVGKSALAFGIPQWRGTYGSQSSFVARLVKDVIGQKVVQAYLAQYGCDNVLVCGSGPRILKAIQRGGQAQMNKEKWAPGFNGHGGGFDCGQVR